MTANVGAGRKVLVHSCFNACQPVKVGSGLNKIFHANPNASCSCSYHVSFADRDAKLAQGEAYVLIRKNLFGHDVPEWREIVLAHKNDRPPVALTIGEHQIDAAYIENQDYQQERINHYGLMTQAMFCGLGASSLASFEG